MKPTDDMDEKLAGAQIRQIKCGRQQSPLAALIFGIAGMSALWLLVIAGLAALYALLTAFVARFSRRAQGINSSSHDYTSFRHELPANLAF